MKVTKRLPKRPVRALAAAVQERGNVTLSCLTGLRDLHLSQTGVDQVLDEFGPVHE